MIMVWPPFCRHTKNHNPIAEVVIFVNVDQRRFSSTAEGKVNRPALFIYLLINYAFVG